MKKKNFFLVKRFFLPLTLLAFLLLVSVSLGSMAHNDAPSPLGHNGGQAVQKEGISAGPNQKSGVELAFHLEDWPKPPNYKEIMLQPESPEVEKDSAQEVSQAAKPKPKPAPQPKPQPEPQPEPEPAPKPDPEPEPEPKPEPEPEPEPNPEPEPVVVYSSEENKMLELVNQERQKAGVPPLTMHKKLRELARLKSQDMIDFNYFDHTSPTYGTPFQMMKNHGISYRSAAENIAKSSSITSAHGALMNSDGHRKNILNPKFNYIGIGVARNSNGTFYITQMFIEPVQ